MKRKNNISRLGGILLLTSLVVGCGLSYPSDKAPVFVDEKGRKIIRTYEDKQRDHLFVEHPKGSGGYISREKFFQENGLKGYDKDIEEAKIKKLVGW